MLWQNRPNTTAIRAPVLPLYYDFDADAPLHCDEALSDRCYRHPYRPAINAGSRHCSHRPVIDSNPAGKSHYSLLHGLISPPSPPPRRSSPHSRKRQFVVRAMPLRLPPFGGLSKTVGPIPCWAIRNTLFPPVASSPPELTSELPIQPPNYHRKLSSARGGSQTPVSEPQLHLLCQVTPLARPTTIEPPLPLPSLDLTLLTPTAYQYLPYIDCQNNCDLKQQPADTIGYTDRALLIRASHHAPTTARDAIGPSADIALFPGNVDRSDVMTSAKTTSTRHTDIR